MVITDIKIRKTGVSPRLRAVVSVTFDDAFVVHDIKVIRSGGRLFLAMPSRKLADGTFSDIAHPISPVLRNELERQVLEAFHAVMGPDTEGGPPDTALL